MTLDDAHARHARRVADAVLYEGYLLYPYRRSATKNQARFQFGVLVPPAYRAVDDTEHSFCQTECLVECPDDARVAVGLRFLRMRRRLVDAVDPAGGELRAVDTLRVDGAEFAAWDEAEEHEERFTAAVTDLLGADAERVFRLPGGDVTEDLRDAAGRFAGRLTRRWSMVDAAIVIHAERVADPYRPLKLRVRVENRTRSAEPPRTRAQALLQALVAAHTLISVDRGVFLSMTDPPEWAAGQVAACVNVGTWPVLAGPADCRNLLLSSPIILYDHPEVAAESPCDLFDATEIDELLTLRTLALTDEEKREARATDPRATELLNHVDHLPPEMLERLHGAVRSLSPTVRAATPRPSAGGDRCPPTGSTVGSPMSDDVHAGDGNARRAEPPRTGPPDDPPRAPWWNPGSDTSVSPETDSVLIAGVPVAKGTKVRMRPGRRRADAQDLFLAGREAVVEAVLHDVDGQVHVAVSPVDDPAAELHRSHGRFRYFAPDELEPLDDRSATPADTTAAPSATPGPEEHGDPCRRATRTHRLCGGQPTARTRDEQKGTR